MSQFIQQLNALPDQFIDTLLDEYQVPGIAMGCFNQSSTYFRTVGEARDKRQVDVNTAFRIASLTKPVFATMFLKMVQKEIYDLDTPIIEYYGDPYLDDPRIEMLTARQVLSHQSGLPNWSHHEPLNFSADPGEKFGYSGEGYVYLQNMLERTIQTDAFRLLRSYIFDPLNMQTSELLPQFLRTDNRCVGHDESGDPFPWRKKQVTEEFIPYLNRMPRYGNVAGTMWSTIREYTLFLSSLCLDPKWGDIFAEMTTPQVEVNDHLSWGIGIGLDRIGDQDIMWHWGSDQGFKSFTFTYLDDLSGITILTNGENGAEVYTKIIAEIVEEVPHYISDGL